METIEKKKWHSVDIVGKWKLMYTVRNSQGSTAFGGKHLGSFKNPYTGEKTYLRNVDNQTLRGMMIDKLVMNLKPDEDENDKLKISWMICHPEVIVRGVPNLDEEILKKKTGRKIELICLDYVEIEKIDEDDYIDRLLGRLSLEGGPQAIGLEKIKFIMAALGMNYNIPRSTAQIEKKTLRSKLKAFSRKSIANSKLVNQAIEEMDESREHYLFKEMVRMRVLELSNGVYKFNNVPVGSSFERSQEFFNNHPEVKTEAIERLANLKK